MDHSNSLSIFKIKIFCLNMCQLDLIACSYERSISNINVTRRPKDKQFAWMKKDILWNMGAA